MEANLYTFNTPWGTSIKSYCRPDRNDYNTALSILREDEYFFNRLPTGGNCIDVGGFIGSAALAMADRGAQVKVVEILPENIETINQNLVVNNLEGQVTVLHNAIGQTSGEIIKAYYTKPDSETGKHHEFVGNTIDGGGEVGAPSLDIPTISLDDLVADLDHVNIFKIDCEGAEWPCFQGASLESLQKIDYIVGELHCLWNWADSSIADFLAVCQDQFLDVSGEYGIDSSQKLTLFVLKNKRL